MCQKRSAPGRKHLLCHVKLRGLAKADFHEGEGICEGFLWTVFLGSFIKACLPEKGYDGAFL